MSKAQRRYGIFGDLLVENNIFIEGGVRGYSSWEIYSRFAPGVLADPSNFLTVDDSGKGVWFYDPTTTFYTYDKDLGLISTYADRFIFPIYFPVTLLGRYAMAVGITGKWVSIQQADVEVWMSDFVADRGPYVLDDPELAGFWTCSISPRGEWILVELVEAVSLNALLFFYRGVKA